MRNGLQLWGVEKLRDSDMLSYTADGEQTGTLDVATTGTGWQS